MFHNCLPCAWALIIIICLRFDALLLPEVSDIRKKFQRAYVPITAHKLVYCFQTLIIRCDIYSVRVPNQKAETKKKRNHDARNSSMYTKPRRAHTHTKSARKTFRKNHPNPKANRETVFTEGDGSVMGQQKRGCVARCPRAVKARHANFRKNKMCTHNVRARSKFVHVCLCLIKFRIRVRVRERMCVNVCAQWI